MCSQTLYSNTSGYSNIAIGDSALKLNTAGGNNVALGYTSLTDNTSGDGNVAIGRNSLANNTTTDYNVAIGDDVLSANTEGFWNIALGSNTMNYTSTAYGNIAMGRNALQGSPTFINNTGSNNIALGQDSINDNGSGSNNIGIGYGTLFTNQAKAGSIAIGYEAMYYADNTVTAGSSYNTAIGYQALKGSTTAGNNTGTGNTVLGYQSGTAITSGSNNTVVGFGAGDSITSSPSNTLIGYLAGQNLTTGSGFNIIIGSGVDAINATGTQQLNIGNTIFGDLSTDSISIGNATLTAGTMFAVGATSQFQVDSNGDIIKLKNLTYSWPSTHATGALINNGSGTLSWQNVPTAAGTATPGQVTFWNGTNSITGNNNFWWDNANVRLGIGTNTPTATLDIGGASSRIANASGDITIDPAGNLIIASGSNVGIGTTTPQAILDVAGVTSEIANSSGSYWFDDVYIASRDLFTIGIWKPNVAEGSYYPINGSIDEVRVYNRPLSQEEIMTQYLQNVNGAGLVRSDKFRVINTSSSELFRITSTGNVGMMTNAPQNTLHVNGTGVLFTNTTGTANVFVFNATTGNVGIGTTSPNFKADITGTINSTSIITNDASGSITTCTAGELRGNVSANKICLCTSANNWKCATVS